VSTLIFVLNSHFRLEKKKKKKIKGDKSIKITANNSNNPKLQHSPHIINNQITQKSSNNTKKIQITQEKGPIISSKAQK
jgi:hypothetical protein